MDFLFSYKEAEIFQAINLTSRYLDDLLNIDNPYFKGMMGRIIHLNYSNIKPVRLIPKPHFWIYIYLHQTDLFYPKFTIREMTLILTH